MSDTNWLIAWLLGAAMVAFAIGFNLWLGGNCYLDYQHGIPQKVCL